MLKPGKLRQGCESADTRSYSIDRHGIRCIHEETFYYQTGHRNWSKTECMAYYLDPLLPSILEGSRDNRRTPSIKDPGGFRSHESKLLTTGMGVRTSVNILEDAQKR